MAATLAELEREVGGLSAPGKMAPARGYSLPALESCSVGGRLAELEGTPCHHCYATRNRYVWPGVLAASRRRLAIVQACEADEGLADRWVYAMAALIRRRSPERFRWHDSGDILGCWHLRLIARVAELTMETAHWLPTQERRTVLEYLRQHGRFPANLTVRVSMPRLDSVPSARTLELSPVSSVATSGRAPAAAHACPATERGNEHTCLGNNCTACWQPSVRWVVYREH